MNHKNRLTRGRCTQDMITVKLVISLFSFLQVKGDCLTGNCEKISLDVSRDARLDTEFVGHVFHNSVTLNPLQCYMWCIHDCRCLSFNYKERNDTKYCELNEGSHFTNNSSLVKSSGPSYYVLRREYGVKVRKKHMLAFIRLVN